ncbi:uncharacterized protein N7483_002025 [Penicillium malachiteum]|uniref:uncharacterized protein n=1 Tax=Penicillium malachiteum TaxID=1324776 RepID=UPI00254791D7|nr:uncharacterized protein N7483_002025 [Penicillium malachiteum]KAJ5736900.1 hypothetical protein N7483_002025 [Penicillium malachiteum]
MPAGMDVARLPSIGIRRSDEQTGANRGEDLAATVAWRRREGGRRQTSDQLQANYHPSPITGPGLSLQTSAEPLSSIG